MDNKLRKLRKPVAWSWKNYSNHKKITRFYPEAWKQPTEITALYSQECVSALTQRIEELEAKLAAPVRLSCETHPRCRTQHAKDVRDAGFVVELCSACNERYCGNCAHANGAKVQ
ncbi:hypothetical protein [Serratia marcescens]|uniref:hypothetical protein n=1 Tax=Serratia marcescens TaxID=615 RepID=UPI003EDA7F3E